MTLADLISDIETSTAYADDLVGDLADRMAVGDTGRIPVLDRGSKHVVGLVARRDLLRVREQVICEERGRRSLIRFNAALEAPGTT